MIPLATDHPVSQIGLTTDQARALTDRIKRAADQLWALLLEAYEGKAWQALGYSSWREYAKAEFQMGQSYAYRLLDQARVVRALEQQTGSPMGEIVTERVARDLKPNLDTVVAAVRERVEDGDDPQDAVRAVVGETRGASNQTAEDDSVNASQALSPASRLGRGGVGCFYYTTSRKRADRSNRIVAQVVGAAQDILVGTERIDFDALDQQYLHEWARELREAARKITRFAARLERPHPKASA